VLCRTIQLHDMQRTMRPLRLSRIRDGRHRQKAQTGFLWSRSGPGPILGIAQPLEDQLRIHRVTKRHLIHGNARRRRLQSDRPLLLTRPKPSRPPLHARTLVSTIIGGHYPAPSARGKAVRPDAYRGTVVSLVANTLTAVFALLLTYC
jgi:hypothetical protein